MLVMLMQALMVGCSDHRLDSLCRFHPHCQQVKKSENALFGSKPTCQDQKIEEGMNFIRLYW